MLGIVNMDQPTKPLFFHVPKRDAATLQPIIRKLIPAGSTIVTDEWRAYIGLGNIYHHLTVNHKQNFVNPRTGNSFMLI